MIKVSIDLDLLGNEMFTQLVDKILGVFHTCVFLYFQSTIVTCACPSNEYIIDTSLFVLFV